MKPDRPTNRRIGAVLRDMREDAGITSTELGARIGRAHGTVSGWERGARTIGVSDLHALCAALEVPTSWAVAAIEARA